MNRKIASRLEALEALEAERAATQAERAADVHLERSRARLEALGFTAGDHSTACACGWSAPGINRYHTGQNADPDNHRCIICGLRRYGQLGDGSWGYLHVADYRCPCCDHAYIGAKGYVGPCPCPRCGWFVPRSPARDDPPDVWAAAVFMNLARVHGVAAAAAWCDVDEAEAAEQVAALRPWWYVETFDTFCAGLREALEAGQVHVYGVLRDGAPASTLCSDPWNIAAEERAPDGVIGMLNRLLAGRQALTGVVVADVPAALAVINDLSALMDLYTLERSA
jgi:hypothetical protein